MVSNFVTNCADGQVFQIKKLLFSVAIGMMINQCRIRTLSNDEILVFYHNLNRENVMVIFVYWSTECLYREVFMRTFFTDFTHGVN